MAEQRAQIQQQKKKEAEFFQKQKSKYGKLKKKTPLSSVMDPKGQLFDSADWAMGHQNHLHAERKSAESSNSMSKSQTIENPLEQAAIENPSDV